MFEIMAKVVSQVKKAPGVYQLKLLAPEIAQAAEPGQFINIACGSVEDYDPLLRRPLTIYRTSPQNGWLELVYKVKGHGTGNLARKQTGDLIPLLGPLGKGFSISTNAPRSIMVSGGMGVASLMSLALGIAATGPRNGRSPDIYALIGAHSADELVCLEDFTALGNRIKLIPWLTRAGLEKTLGQLLNDLKIEGVNLHHCAAYACGPKGMLRRVAQWTKELEMACQVSLEAHMACGLGACQSCICQIRDVSHPNEQSSRTYKLVCKHGPVFSAKEIDWSE